MTTPPLFGGLETGGTHCRVVVGRADGHITAETEIATGLPGPTLAAVCEWLAPRNVRALGVAAFGPIDLDLGSPRFGTLLGTPKDGWSGANVIAPLRAKFRVPIALDTDVNGAVLAEATLGAARGARSAAYFTVGTGVGLGLLIEGRPVHGLLHPEFGHFRPRRDRRDWFTGACPIHGDCLEGLVSGPALRARTRVDPALLAEDDPAFEFAAEALGEAVAALTLAVSVERVVIGGGVMRDGFLLPKIRAAARAALAGYPTHPLFTGDAVDWIVSPGLGSRSGATGALLLAAHAANSAN